jgi:hypothetical protein
LDRLRTLLGNRFLDVLYQKPKRFIICLASVRTRVRLKQACLLAQERFY